MFNLKCRQLDPMFIQSHCSQIWHYWNAEIDKKVMTKGFLFPWSKMDDIFFSSLSPQILFAISQIQ